MVAQAAHLTAVAAAASLATIGAAALARLTVPPASGRPFLTAPA
jgi:hypothetical protein